MPQLGVNLHIEGSWIISVEGYGVCSLGICIQLVAYKMQIGIYVHVCMWHNWIDCKPPWHTIAIQHMGQKAIKLSGNIQPGKKWLIISPIWFFGHTLGCFKWTTRRDSHWLRLQKEWVWRMWVLAQTNRLRNWQLSTLALGSILNAAGRLHTARSPLSPVFSCVYYAYTMTLACVNVHWCLLSTVLLVSANITIIIIVSYSAVQQIL